MARPPAAADYKALRRLHDAAGSRKRLNRWIDAALKEGKQKAGRKKYQDRLSIDTFRRLGELRGRKRAEAIRQLVRSGKIRGAGTEASTVERFSREFHKLEKNMARFVDHFRAALPDLIRTTH